MARRALRTIIDALLGIAAILYIIFTLPMVLLLEKLLKEEEE